ncbi:MAG TPA: hypothetical protein VGU01_14770 [Sphingomicrobium sp.]|nr:hypothetical protein [Sphingomicrobium sp.]
MTAVTLALTPSLAKKPDWPGINGSGVIGFGIVELIPGLRGNPGSVQFAYDIPAAYSDQIASGQILVMPVSALRDYDDIPQSALVAQQVGQAPKTGAFHMVATIHVSKPGVYVVAYGPYDGLLKFDDIDDSQATYKISATATGGGTVHWIDQDAGDFTISRFHKNSADTSPVLRLRMLRDRENVLRNRVQLLGAPIQLNARALKRVQMIDANW